MKSCSRHKPCFSARASGMRATVEAAQSDCPSLATLVLAGLEQAEGNWQSFSEIVAKASPSYPRPADAACGQDPATIFFSSGTTGHPKMVLHNFNYPFGHVMTGSYWHDIEPGNLHLTVADTGWAKSVWGKFYGQWLAGGVVFVWDFRGKFEPARLLARCACDEYP